MSENNFQAPPPKAPMPPSPVFMPKVTGPKNEEKTTESAKGIYDDNFAADLNLPPKILQTKSMGIVMGVVLVLGIIFGAAFFGGSEAPKQVSGLQGVVPNMDISPNDTMYRCGTVDKGQACILYIMNHTRYDRTAEDFFDEAVRLTEVSRYSISMVNTRYAKQRIGPGHFAQIKIPKVL